MDVRDILNAVRAKDFSAANQGFASVMQTKLADRLAVEKRVVANEALKESTLHEAVACDKCGEDIFPRVKTVTGATCMNCWKGDSAKKAEKAVNEGIADMMPVHEVQRVFDEIGDVDETQLLCGVRQLKVSENGQVVSYVSEAIDRPNTSGQGYDDSYMHNPYHGVIRKYGYQYSHSTPVRTSSGVEIHHTYKQGEHNVAVWGNNWSTSTSAGSSGYHLGGHPNTARAEGDLERHLRDKARRYGLSEDFMYGGLDSKCDKCDSMADWRGRDPKTGQLLASACKAHKDQVKSELLQKLQGTKR